MRWPFWAALGLLLFASCVRSAHAAAPDKVVLAAHSVCPLGCLDERGEFSGEFVDVVRAACERTGVELELRVFPVARAQHMASGGMVDGFFPAFRTDERDKIGVLSTGVVFHSWCWYLFKYDDRDPLSADFKASGRTGGVRNGVMARWLRENGYQLAGAPGSVSVLVDMLLAHRVDAILDTREALEEEIIPRRLQDRLKAVPQEKRPVGIYFTHAFLERHPGFLERFNAAVMAIQAERAPVQ